MQIFVSWSGHPAKDLADFLQTWLRRVIQELDPFMSKNSIEKGARWSAEISERLNSTNQAIVCVTRDNLKAEWLNFEAGALAKATDSRVRTLLVDLTAADVTGPLSEFQHTLATSKEDVRELIRGINQHCERKLPDELLDAVFEREWPDFETKVTQVIELARKQPGTGTPKKRPDSDILAEILDRVRMIEREPSGRSAQLELEMQLERISHELRTHKDILRDYLPRSRSRVDRASEPPVEMANRGSRTASRGAKSPLLADLLTTRVEHVRYGLGEIVDLDRSQDGEPTVAIVAFDGSPKPKSVPIDELRPEASSRSSE